MQRVRWPGSFDMQVETPCPASDPVPGVFPMVECQTATGVSYNAHFASAAQAYAPLRDGRFSFTRHHIQVSSLNRAGTDLRYQTVSEVQATGAFAQGQFTGVMFIAGVPCGQHQNWSARWVSMSHFAPVP